MGKIREIKFIEYNSEGTEKIFEVNIDILKGNNDVSEIALFEFNKYTDTEISNEQLIEKFKDLYEKELSMIEKSLKDRSVKVIYDLVFLRVYSCIDYNSPSYQNLLNNHYKLYVPSLDFSEYSSEEFCVFQKKDDGVILFENQKMIFGMLNMAFNRHGVRREFYNTKEKDDALDVSKNVWKSSSRLLIGICGGTIPENSYTEIIEFHAREDRETVANSLY